MRKPPAFAIAGIVICLSYGCSQRDTEPSFHGEPLSKWITIYASTGEDAAPHREAEAAIRHIGTNGIPFLIRWISEAKPPPASIDPDQIDARGLAASTAFSALKNNAAIAVPDLTRNLNKGSDAASAYAGHALGRLGAPGVPPLIAALGHQRAEVRKNAADFLVYAGTNALPAKAALEQHTNDPSPEVRAAVSNILTVLGNLERAAQR